MNIIKKPLLLICSAGQLLYANWFLHDQKKTSKELALKVEQSNTMLNFLYSTNPGKLIRSGLTKKWFSIAAGMYCDSSLSKYHINSFIIANNIDMNEAIQKAEEFATFNEFFTRKLKTEARPIDQQANSIISPADGNILVFQHCATTKKFPIKSVSFNLEQFLNDQKLAEEFANGTVVIIRICPHDYHRFHFPYTCIPAVPQKINGNYESVNPIAYYTGIQPLTENERRLYMLKTTTGDDILMVSVGAMCVGKIIESYQAHTQYEKGAEAGYFCFGGSTIVLIFKHGTIQIDKHIMVNSLENKEMPIKMGQKIGIMLPHN